MYKTNQINKFNNLEKDVNKSDNFKQKSLEREQKSFKIDCKGYDLIPSVMNRVDRIIVLGDIHGDYHMVIRSLVLAKVIRVVDNNDPMQTNLSHVAESEIVNAEIKKYNDKTKMYEEHVYKCLWIGGKTVVVQVGDQIDRCRPYKYACDVKEATVDDEASDIKIMYFFTDLDKKAQRHGGRVISLLGNHEILNSLGIMTYVSHDGLKQFEKVDDVTNKVIKDGTSERTKAFKPGNDIANFMACTRVSCIIIGSNLFVHAAILPILMEKYKINHAAGLTGINTAIRKWLLGQIDKKKINDLLVNEHISPFWPRILGRIPPNTPDYNEACVTYLNPALDILQLGSVIVGHTPQYYTHNEGINSACSKKLWRVDIGSSEAFEPFDKVFTNDKNNHVDNLRRIQVLEIIDDDQFNVIKEEDDQVVMHL